MTNAPIALVDDDDLLLESLSRNLEDAGFPVHCFADGDAFLTEISDNGAFRLVVLDWKMPGMTGIEVLRRLREARNEIPVIFLTVLGDQIYEEAALHGGAVDFVEKTRGFAILQKRIELALGPKLPQIGEQDAETECIKVGSLEFNPPTGPVLWKDNDVALTISELSILNCLIRQTGEHASYRTLYDVVHHQGFRAGEGELGYKTNVRAFIKRIRNKFRVVDPDFDQIKNFPGFGYSWEDDS